MYGTDVIKDFLDYGFSLAHRIKTVKAEDSPGGEKVTWGEIVGSIGLITKIPGLIGKADDLYIEWKDLDDLEVTEIRQYFADKFDISNDLIEADIEDVWEIMLRIGRIVERHTK